MRASWLVAIGCSLATVAAAGPPIDRYALVTRHNPVLDRIDFESPLTVGNGGFAFTADITGLQTFPSTYHREGVPTETLARWAWASEPNPAGYRLEAAYRPYRQADGRTVEYPTDTESAAGQWLRRNPHDQPLACVGLDWTNADGRGAEPADLRAPHQTLDLWHGRITSRFELHGAAVRVETVAHPDRDAIAVRIVSSLLRSNALRARIAFPRGHVLTVKNTPPLDWGRPESYETTVVGHSEHAATIATQIDEARYWTRVAWTDGGRFSAVAPHVFQLAAPEADELTFTIEFAPQPVDGEVPSADATFAASADRWEQFWRTAAALDLGGSSNPRAAELERRVVLSQYLTAVQSVGAVPPQESGLTCSTWYGKHHTEMIWWHAAHFALWNRPDALAHNLDWYVTHLGEARTVARSRGLRGARWPKMAGPDARESPGGNPLIVWNQPHPIYLAELLYRAMPASGTLAHYRDLVLETGTAMEDMLWFDPSRRQYVLGPPLWIAQEIHDPVTSQNPGFELAYWRWALGVAQQWRERLGLPRSAKTDDILAKLPPLPRRHGCYVALESSPDTWDNPASRHDHPEMLMALGFLPATPVVDARVMNRTLDAVLQHWDWATKIWGWDYPMIAMTATRLGRPADAIEVLLRDGPNNRYLPNGHCPQRSDQAASAPTVADRGHRSEIAAYLPANGALLSAVALMVAGWDGCTGPHPGFPRDGTWQVRAEGWQRLP